MFNLNLKTATRWYQTRFFYKFRKMRELIGRKLKKNVYFYKICNIIQTLKYSNRFSNSAILLLESWCCNITTFLIKDLAGICIHFISSHLKKVFCSVFPLQQDNQRLFFSLWATRTFCACCDV